MANPRILIVEDENIVAIDLEEDLAGLGYHITGIADTGRKALRLAEETDPDLVVMDIQIKGDLTGIDTAIELRRRFQIPVVFLTAFADQATIELARQAGPLAYLSKPFRIQELNATIVVALQQDRLTRDLFAERTWLTTLLEGIHEGVIATDALGTVRFLNPKAERLTGWSSIEAMDRTIEEIGAFDTGEAHAAESLLRQTMRTASAIYRQRCVLRARNGSEIALEASSTPVVAAGRVVGAITVLHDSPNHLSSAEPVIPGGTDSPPRSVDEMRSIAQLLLTAQEEERRRVARELHDDLCQRLAALGMEASILPRFLGESHEVLSRRIRDLASRIGGLADELHTISRQIHPVILTDLGLAAATEEECRLLSERLSIPVHFECDGIPRALPDDSALCLYRVAQESLRNIRKHANAPEVRVRLARSSDELHLSIEDMGGGFDCTGATRRAGLGLVSMRERVHLLHGKLSIFSQPGQGTRVEVSIPWTEAQT